MIHRYSISAVVLSASIAATLRAYKAMRRKYPLTRIAFGPLLYASLAGGMALYVAGQITWPHQPTQRDVLAFAIQTAAAGTLFLAIEIAVVARNRKFQNAPAGPKTTVSLGPSATSNPVVPPPLPRPGGTAMASPGNKNQLGPAP
jgi:hypothetical protein